ncbi:MAG: SRPBCC family protein, partial [Longimicrobiales bacterium]
MNERVLRKETWLPHAPEKVWVALTDRHALAEWLMPNDFAPQVGHKFRFQVDPMPGLGAGIQECVVLEVDPLRKLVYSWVVVPRKPTRARPKPMVLTWTLVPEQEGTYLILEQTGIEHVGAWVRFSMNMGWGRMLKTLLPRVMPNVT